MSSGELAQLVRARSILKAADLDRILSVEHYLANARATADLVMQEANHRALKMSAETQLAADRLKIEARESGYQQGLQQAREEQAESIVRNQTELARSWMQKDQKISFLVTQILGKILAESDAQPHFFAAVTRRALRTVRDQRLLVFKVSPEQLDIARSCVARALAEHHAPGFVEVLGEPEIPVGGCLIATEYTEINAGLSAQLEVLHKALSELFARQSAEQTIRPNDPLPDLASKL